MFAGISVSGLISKIILNTSLSSIPEELFLTIFMLILIKEFDYLKYETPGEAFLFDRWNCMRVFIPAIMAAFVSNILRYTGVSFIYNFQVIILIIVVVSVIMNELWKVRNSIILVLKMIFSLLFGLFIITIVEFSYIPFVLYSTGKTIEYMNNSILMNFLMTLPERAIETAIIVFLLSNKTSIIRSNIFKCVLKSKVLICIVISTVLFNFLIMILLCQVIGYNKVLTNLSIELQTIIIVGVLLFPVINLLALFFGIYYNDNNVKKSYISGY